MPFNTQKLNYENAVVDITYVQNKYKLSDILSKEEYYNNSEESLKEIIQTRINSLPPVTQSRIYIDKDYVNN